MKIERISPTLLNSFLSCPLAFKYSFALMPEVEIDDSRAVLGTEIHSQIATYLKDLRNDITEQEMLGLSKQVFGEDKRQSKIIKNFLEFEKQRVTQFKRIKPDIVEGKLYANLYEELPIFVTIVDAYWKDDETCINWKIGSSNELYESNIIQGAIETMVLAKNNNQTRHHWFVHLGNSRILETPSVQEGWLKSKCIELLDSVKADYFPKRKSGLCDNYCKYIIRCEFEGRCLWSL